MRGRGWRGGAGWRQGGGGGGAGGGGWAGVWGGGGAGAESVVGLCLERGADMVVAVLAVWLAGGGYLPLEPEYPAGRLGFMLADSGVGVLVGHRAVAGGVAAQAAGQGAAVVMLDDPAVASRVGGVPAGGAGA